MIDQGNKVAVVMQLVQIYLELAYKNSQVIQNTVVGGVMKCQGPNCDSKHLNPLRIIKNVLNISQYIDYMQIGCSNVLLLPIYSPTSRKFAKVFNLQLFERD